MKKVLPTLLAVLLLSFSLIQNASAITIPPGGSAQVDERFNPLTLQGAYSVTNNSNFSLFAVAIGNNTATSALTTRANWSAQLVSAALWNDTLTSIFGNQPSGVLTFDQYFANYLSANVYYTTSGNTIGAGTTTGYEFLYSALTPNSPFVAFYQNANGGIQTFTGIANVNSVPLPAAAWLFASALIGLVGSIKRRH